MNPACGRDAQNFAENCNFQKVSQHFFDGGCPKIIQEPKLDAKKAYTGQHVLVNIMSTSR